MVRSPQAQSRFEAIVDISNGHACHGSLQILDVIVFNDIIDCNVALEHLATYHIVFNTVSLVHVRDVGVAGSNPVTPTIASISFFPRTQLWVSPNQALGVGSRCIT
jgi:hypothetical protein